jgi:flagellar motor switch protein FliN
MSTTKATHVGNEDGTDELSVELCRVTMPLKDIASRLAPGSVIALSKLTGEKLDVRINDRLVARGEAVAVGERYGIRVVEIITGDKEA